MDTSLPRGADSPSEESEPAPRRTTPPGPGRVLALDVGERRIGVAMSDSRGVLASPLTTLKAEPRERVLVHIAALVHEHRVETVVVGLPLTMAGEVGPQARLVQSFAADLEHALGQRVHLFDERLTSVVAEQMMRDLGVKPARRKARIDEVAASIILQDYLDHLRGNSEGQPG